MDIRNVGILPEHYTASQPAKTMISHVLEFNTVRTLSLER